MSQPLERPLSEVLFITEFRDFCRSKGDEEYSATAPSHCALAQFGFPDVHWNQLGGVPQSAFDAAVFGDTGDGSGPFSALAQRLDALLPASVERVRG